MADCISREAVMADLSAAAEKGGMGQIIADTLMRYVKCQPAADVEPVRHGHWTVKKGSDGFPYFEHEECGKKYRLVGDLQYCPNCGAKMDGGAVDG